MCVIRKVMVFFARVTKDTDLKPTERLVPRVCIISILFSIFISHLNTLVLIVVMFIRLTKNCEDFDCGLGEEPV